MAVEKKVQGNNPASTNSGYGRSPAGTLAMRPKNSVKTTIISAGWSTAHATPSNVCLYRTFTSRQTRKYNSSRKRHSSAKLTSCQPEEGSMMVCGRATNAASKGSAATAGGAGPAVISVVDMVPG